VKPTAAPTFFRASQDSRFLAPSLATMSCPRTLIRPFSCLQLASRKTFGRPRCRFQHTESRNATSSFLRPTTSATSEAPSSPPIVLAKDHFDPKRWLLPVPPPPEPKRMQYFLISKTPHPKQLRKKTNPANHQTNPSKSTQRSPRQPKHAANRSRKPRPHRSRSSTRRACAPGSSPRQTRTRRASATSCW
jgi:hypothetical protein